MSEYAKLSPKDLEEVTAAEYAFLDKYGNLKFTYKPDDKRPYLDIKGRGFEAFAGRPVNGGYQFDVKRCGEQWEYDVNGEIKPDGPSTLLTSQLRLLYGELEALNKLR